MTPYELAMAILRDLSPMAPRLSAALNRALVDIGEGSALVGLGPGTHENDAVSFQEMEQFDVGKEGQAGLLYKITETLKILEQHSSWRVIMDIKPADDPNRIDLLYTLYREKP